MKFCFTLDDVIRAKSQQILKMYRKYEDNSFDIDSVDLKTNNFQDILGFETKQEYMTFLYEDYPFEIFAEANTTQKMIDKELNLWLLNFKENYDTEEPILANPFEFNASIGFTHFFLSKIAPRIRETYFPVDSLTIWDKCDVLITAEPKLLENKPEGKIAIKINMPYNEECEADYTFDTLSDFLNDNEVMNVIYGFESIGNKEYEDIDFILDDNVEEMNIELMAKNNDKDNEE